MNNQQPDPARQAREAEEQMDLALIEARFLSRLQEEDSDRMIVALVLALAMGAKL